MIEDTNQEMGKIRNELEKELKLVQAENGALDESIKEIRAKMSQPSQASNFWNSLKERYGPSFSSSTAKNKN